MAGINLTVPCAVVQLSACLVGTGEPLCISQERPVVQCGVPKGGVGALGQGRLGGEGGASLLGPPGGGGGSGRGQQC